MNDDLIGKVAEAIRAGCPCDPSTPVGSEHAARAAVAAHTEWLLAQGGVTDEARWFRAGVAVRSRGIVESIGEARTDGDATAIIDAHNAAVRTLIAHAVAQAVADKEQMRVDLLAACEALTAEAQRLAADRDALRAKVARVEALCVDMDQRDMDPWYWTEVTEEIRAALADEDGDA